MAIPHKKDLLLQIVDKLATESPQAIYAEYPIATATYQQGFHKITYGALANAVNGFAWWLHRNLGPCKTFDTVAYIGPNDLRYPALILGSNKAGYKVLLASPRNSPAAQWHLLKSLNCQVLLTPTPRPPAISAILETQQYPLKVIEVPSVSQILEIDHPHFSYTKSFEEARQDPFVVLHTSGTTGLPKPIIWPQDWPSSLSKQVQLDPPTGFESIDRLYSGNRVIVFFPPFHAAYLAHVMVNPITNLTTVILPLQSTIPSAKGLANILDQTAADAAFGVPLIIDEMSKDIKLRDHIASKLKTLVFSGGDLPSAIGDKVTSKIRLVNWWGATETGSLALIRPQGPWINEDWKYVMFHPDSGFEFRRYSEDIHELYIVRNEDFWEFQPIFTLFPEIQEYRTRDLWVRHPTKENRWRHCGRADDIIVFVTGEKTNPVSTEQFIVAQNSEVGGALVTGSNRFQAGLLIETAEQIPMSPKQKALLIEKIWPSVVEANRESPAHAKIAKSHILFTNPGKPMTRTPKGTIQRSGTLNDYNEEIEKLYRDAEYISANSDMTIQVVPETASALQEFIQDSIRDITGISVSSADNFFENGLDSLQSLQLTSKLRSVLRFKNMSPSLIYANPTAESLSNATNRAKVEELSQNDSLEQDRIGMISQTLSKFQSLVDNISSTSKAGYSKPTQSAEKVVVLTGSTGATGSYLLDRLLKDPSVRHIYCLNRSKDALEVQKRRNSARALQNEFSNRVTFIQATLDSSDLGLSNPAYNVIRETVTTIIHNAWPVNFNLSLVNFESSLKGVINLVQLMAASKLQASFIFISSISSVASLSGKISERIISEDSAPLPMGYAESKYIAERVLSHAATTLDIDVRIVRVGQIAGPTNGPSLWNENEWFPSLIISSSYLKQIPATLPELLESIDWIPIDQLAAIITELALKISVFSDTVPPQATVVHIKNPHIRSWGSLLPTAKSIIKEMSGGTDISTVQYNDWVHSVRESLEEASRSSTTEETNFLNKELKQNPAAKLLDFYREQGEKQSNTNILETSVALELSQEMSRLTVVQDRWMEKWLRSWLS